MHHDQCVLNNSMFDDKKIRAIIFDWGGTCGEDSEPFALQSLLQTLGKTPDEISYVVRDLLDDFYKGKISSDLFWPRVLERFGLLETQDMNCVLLSAAYLSTCRPFDEILGSIIELRKKYKTGLLSNLTPLMRDHIRKQESWFDYFDAEVYSCDSNIMERKPDISMYNAITKKLGVSPENCLFIDNTSHNVIAAKDFGMQGLLFTSVAQCLADTAALLQ